MTRTRASGNPRARPPETSSLPADGRVTKLNLYKCTSLAELPVAIGEFGALTELNLRECSSLAELPDAIGELKALTTLELDQMLRASSRYRLAIGELGSADECSSLSYPPEEMRGTCTRRVSVVSTSWKATAR